MKSIDQLENELAFGPTTDNLDYLSKAHILIGARDQIRRQTEQLTTIQDQKRFLETEHLQSNDKLVKLCFFFFDLIFDIELCDLRETLNSHGEATIEQVVECERQTKEVDNVLQQYNQLVRK